MVDLEADAAELKTYIDSRGVEMAFMKYSDALNHIESLASDNQIDENDIDAGDRGLSSQKVWQDKA